VFSVVTLIFIDRVPILDVLKGWEVNCEENKDVLVTLFGELLPTKVPVLTGPEEYEVGVAVSDTPVCVALIDTPVCVNTEVPDRVFVPVLLKLFDIFTVLVPVTTLPEFDVKIEVEMLDELFEEEY
jgi:hypothetical protein